MHRGHAFIDRALYRKSDLARMHAAHVANTIAILTKPALASATIDPAIDAYVPLTWVATDGAYGIGKMKKASPWTRKTFARNEFQSLVQRPT